MIHKLLKRVFRYIFRDAVTGKFVSKEFAESHPDTTVKERLR